MSDWLNRKLRDAFNALDTNNSGELSMADVSKTWICNQAASSKRAVSWLGCIPLAVGVKYFFCEWKVTLVKNDVFELSGFRWCPFLVVDLCVTPACFSGCKNWMQSTVAWSHEWCNHFWFMVHCLLSGVHGIPNTHQPGSLCGGSRKHCGQ